MVMKRLLRILKLALSEPLARGFDLDDPHLTEARRSILQRKGFLRAIYREWYQLLLSSIPEGTGKILELGSGSGFAKETIPDLVTSEIFWLSNVKLVTDGCALPFEDQSLKAIVMTDVFHHIPRAKEFLSEATRCLKPGGIIAMVEPWVNSWSTLIYQNLHHESFSPDEPAWEFETSGPLSGANGALPWIVFVRDRQLFSRQFPRLSVNTISPMMPYCYLLSGGLTMRSMVPGFVYRLYRRVENWIERRNPNIGMFAFIVVRKSS